MNKRVLRVAVCMGGGVSLGSFCGGALGETVNILGKHLNRSEFERVEFDIFSGASAGALSLGLMLRTLAHPSTSGNDSKVTDQEYEAWVRLIDIEQLIPDIKMSEAPSLLSRKAVERIATRMMAWRDGTQPSKSPLLSDQVFFACTLANLNGIRIDGREKEQGLAFYDGLQTTLHRDIRTFAFDFARNPRPAHMPRNWIYQNDMSRSAVWRELAATCIACGAFPIAFEPVVLERKANEYGRLWPFTKPGTAGEANLSRESFPFTFSDGGMFNNEPLKEAMELIRWRDSDATDVDRLLIFIDPNFSGAPVNYELDFHRGIYVEPPDKTIPWFSGMIDGEDVTRRPFVERLISAAGPLINGLSNQASFKDWIKADKINNQIEWRDMALRSLCEVVKKLDAQSADELGTSTMRVLEQVLEEKQQVSISPSDELLVDSEVARIKKEDPELLHQFQNKHQEELFIYLTSMIDQLGGLRKKQSVAMLGIGPVAPDGAERFELAGDFLSSFGGFFHLDYRHYDFLVGEAMAARALKDFRYEPKKRNCSLLTPDAIVKNPPPNTREYFGTEPALDDPRHKKKAQRFFQRFSFVLSEALDGFLDLPFNLEKMLKPAIGMVGGILKNGDRVPHRLAVVALHITREHSKDRFTLIGRAGGDGLPATEVRNGICVIETLVFYPTNIKDSKLTGPHVHDADGRYCLVVREGGPWGQRIYIELPDAGTLRNALEFGCCAHIAEFRWPAPPNSDAWRQVELLRALSETLVIE